jgi:hypothetical protein
MHLAHPDFDQLYDQLLRHSKMFLDQQDGHFLPHGAVVSWDGKTGVVGVDTKEKRPDARVTLQQLMDGLRKMAASGKFRATGVAIDMRLKTPPRKEDVGRDAICVALENKDGLCQSVFTPYVRSKTGSFTYYEPFVIPEKSRIFPTQM